MKILAIDTATENCSAALLIDGNVRSREIEMERGHAERILPMVDDLLTEAGITLQDLDAIAFGRGPGSFTGVRLAVTVTQGLAFGAGLGVVAVSDLRAVAQRAFDCDATLTRALVCNDARMSEVYWACYERGGDGLARLEGEERVSKPSEVKLPAQWSTATAVGRGFIAYADALRAAVPNVVAARPQIASTLAAATSAAGAASTVAAGAVPAAAPAIAVADAAAVAPPADPTSITLLQLLPHATQIARLALPEVTAGHLIPAEAAAPIYLR
ncbi:MAG TPA: tRNA (adenosine(37)-N6)-threonylcarbamoyltransferase complex dimerization subunit type 1 TsaB, partial [Steroidobacteraceae bacterium]|nr:tRNA (adenosine(37)-N6)-threonylcarbamoyltransferase complex dimerization subunit type 1 TsaB [Steroidobacteraceae bacterium]